MALAALSGSVLRSFLSLSSLGDRMMTVDFWPAEEQQALLAAWLFMAQATRG